MVSRIAASSYFNKMLKCVTTRSLSTTASILGGSKEPAILYDFMNPFQPNRLLDLEQRMDHITGTQFAFPNEPYEHPGYDNQPICGPWTLHKELAGPGGRPFLVSVFFLYLVNKEHWVLLDPHYMHAYTCMLWLWLIFKFRGDKMYDDWLKAKDEEYAPLQYTFDYQIETKQEDLVLLQEAEELWHSQEPLLEAKREINAMLMETQFRETQVAVQKEIKKRLDYQIDLQDLLKKQETEHIANWVTNEVINSITPKDEEDAIANCILEIEALAAAKNA